MTELIVGLLMIAAIPLFLGAAIVLGVLITGPPVG